MHKEELIDGASPRPWEALPDIVDDDGWYIVDANNKPVARCREIQLYDSCSIIKGLTEEDAKLIVHAVNAVFGENQ